MSSSSRKTTRYSEYPSVSNSLSLGTDNMAEFLTNIAANSKAPVLTIEWC